MNLFPARLFTALAMLLLLTAAAKKPKMAPPAKPAGDKPAITSIQPRGIQRGVELKVKLLGTNLVGLTEVKFSDAKLRGTLDPEAKEKATEAWIKVNSDADLPRGSYDLSVVNAKGESGKVKFFVDDLPQVYETAENSTNSVFAVTTPVTFWGTLEPMGDSDEITFDVKAGQKLVVDVAARSIGSKANVNLHLYDARGAVVASCNDFDAGDPLIHFEVPKTGRYALRITEETLGGSAEHFYRVSVGEFPLVIGGFPLSLRTNVQAQVELVGYNLPKHRTVSFDASKAGEVEVPIKEFRIRKAVKVLATDETELLEREPNNSAGEAMPISVPSIVNGRITGVPLANAKTKEAYSLGPDADHFRFEARAGQVLVIETDAARRGSPIDTKIEVLDGNGAPVEQVLLQAVRNSQINFRPIDSQTGDVRVENWEEMELNEFMYLNGEVCRIFRMPEGPDSGFQYYRNGGKRVAYFNTSATSHALDEQCYVVEPHPPGTKLVANGLPVFTVHYANDDDGEREFGADSRILFYVPANGNYLVRVTDTRGTSGDRFAYRLIVREARPDFKVTLGGGNPTVQPGSGQEFTFAVDRIDGFNGDIRLDIQGVPEGFSMSTPIVIQSGHLQAAGTISASADAKAPSKDAMAKIKITATAEINGQTVTKDLSGFGQIKVGEKPKLIVAIEPYDEANTNFTQRALADAPQEIILKPDDVVPAWLKIKRDGHDELVTFTVENLPHGVIVDNIGLNGVLIPKGENERQIFLRCAKWVGDIDRLAYCQAKQSGNPTSLPVVIKVRRPVSQTTASK